MLVCIRFGSEEMVVGVLRFVGVITPVWYLPVLPSVCACPSQLVTIDERCLGFLNIKWDNTLIGVIQESLLATSIMLGLRKLGLLR